MCRLIRDVHKRDRAARSNEALHHYLFDCQSVNMKSAIYFILLTQIASCMQLPLRTEQNSGLQYFQTMGFLIDDMVPARLVVEISLEPAMKAVYKVEAFFRDKDANSTATARAVRASLSQDIQRAARRLRDTERLLFQVPDLPQRPKRQFLGAAAMAASVQAHLINAIPDLPDRVLLSMFFCPQSNHY